MSATPKYIVSVKFYIGWYEGDWDGAETEMKPKEEVLFETLSKTDANTLFNRLVNENKPKKGETE